MHLESAGTIHPGLRTFLTTSNDLDLSQSSQTLDDLDEVIDNLNGANQSGAGNIIDGDPDPDLSFDTDPNFSDYYYYQWK